MSTARTLHELAITAASWQTAARAERERRRMRDEGIRAAADAGALTGQIAQAAGVDPSLVYRVLHGQRGAYAKRPAVPGSGRE